jgi:hypothetical protein
MGYTVIMQPFAAPRDTLYLGPAAVAGGFLCAALAGRWHPWLGLLLCTLLLIPLAGEMLGSSRVDLDRLLPRYPSRNVVARAPAEAATAPRRLVISAHIDTQRASYLFHPAFVPYLRLYFDFVYATLLFVPVVLGLRQLLPGRPWTGPLLAAAAGLLSFNLLFLLLCRVTGRYINGANDNGTGVALLLALAERFAGEPLPGTELTFLLTGAEEVGTRGMKAFLRETPPDRSTTWFINLDNLGGGSLHYLTGEGMLAVRPYGAALLRLAGEMSARFPGRVRPRSNLLLPTDGSVPALAGYEAISFLAFDERGELPDYHWYSDTLANVDRELLAFAEQFLGEYVQRASAEHGRDGSRPRGAS